MFGQVRGPWGAMCAVAVVALSALPAAAQSASTTVTISVPPVQKVEGTASLVVSASTPLLQGRLIIKSNTSWVMVAHSSSPDAVVAWKLAGSSIWQQLGAATPVLTGLKGVRQVEFEVRLDNRTARPGAPVTVTFSVEQVVAH